MKEAVTPAAQDVWLVNPKGNVVSVPAEWWDMDVFIAKTPYTGRNATPDGLRKWYAAMNPQNKTLHASYHPLPPYRVATEEEVRAQHPQLVPPPPKPAADLKSEPPTVAPPSPHSDAKDGKEKGK